MIARLGFAVLLMLGLAGFGGVAWIASQDAPVPPTTLGVTTMVRPPPEAPQAPASRTTRPVVVAIRDLVPGEFLRPADLGLADLPENGLPKDVLSTLGNAGPEIAGALMRQPRAAGQPLRQGDLLFPDDRSFMAAALSPGHRATTISVEGGAVAVVWPGDRVDVLLMQTGTEAATSARRIGSSVIIADLRVLAADRPALPSPSPAPGMQQAGNAQPGGRGAAAGRDAGFGSSPQSALAMRGVTLDVTPAQAERLAVAAQAGRLSLLVRPAASERPPSPAPSGGTWGSDVLPTPPADSGAPRILRIHRGQDETREVRF